MGSNSFGKIFRITTFGESHGEVVGVVIDGCPSGISVHYQELKAMLDLRRPRGNELVSQRAEKDSPKIISGVFEGKTTGAPITILIENTDVDSEKYEATKNILRPSHANYVYLKKYGIYDYRGGGRASARETVGRVAAGYIAMNILKRHGIKTAAFIKSIGDVRANVESDHIEKLREKTYTNPVFCPDKKASLLMREEVLKVKSEGDSIGGVVEFIIEGTPVGLGEPIYDKLESRLASAMMSIPAAKGFEIGEGFLCSNMKGSENNDEFIMQDKNIVTKTNHAGGLLAGISNGMPIVGRVAFKPTPSIMLPQKTTDFDGNKVIFEMPKGSRHDPCVAIRAVPVVESMCALVIADFLLLQKKWDCYADSGA